jgi:hypothetical protein
MKKLTYIIAALIVSISTLSCSKNNNFTEEPQINQTDFMKKNVAFTDARVRSLNESSFVKELVLTNFSDINLMPTSLVFKEYGYTDDGTHNDVIANDGIYTSVTQFNHDKEVPYIEEHKIRSV